MVGYLTEEQPAVVLAVLCVLEFGVACNPKMWRRHILAVLAIWAVSPPILDLGGPPVQNEGSRNGGQQLVVHGAAGRTVH